MQIRLLCKYPLFTKTSSHKVSSTKLDRPTQPTVPNRSYAKTNNKVFIPLRSSTIKNFNRIHNLSPISFIHSSIKVQSENTTAMQQMNRLANEKSPYLLQHKNNPVDWYPWKEEAFEKARKEDKPIFLSVGYSTCHWCHVMAHESFENPAIASIMNEYFVNIKLDREERPDIDKIYMTFVQATTGGGGWPMSVFLTPDLKPIYGGTYFPPVSQYGRPGFPDILKFIANNWHTKRDELVSQGERIVKALQEATDRPTSEEWAPLSYEPIEKCYEQISKSFDPVYGGFGKAPKFPRPSVFQILYRVAAHEGISSQKGQLVLDMVNLTLTNMGNGGIFDHLGGGFHRYSVTKDWHIPHFEKMLYDQAQLVNAYLTAFQFTKNPYYETRARNVMDYVMSITSPEGGFYSAEDADSLIEHGKPEHAEGAFYVFTHEEIIKVLGEDAKIFNYVYDVRPEGNVPENADPHGELKNKNHLKINHSIEETSTQFKMQPGAVSKLLEACRQKLFEYRAKRPRPHLDDKIITAWNGLMISAYARGFQILQDAKYLTMANNSASFIFDNLYNKDTKKLIRNYRQGPSDVNGFSDDYAFLIEALLDLYEASFEVKWLEWAITLQETQNKLFWDHKSFGYFAAEAGDKTLLLRMKEDYDGAEPCSNSVSALSLLRLSQLTGDNRYKNYAQQIFAAFIDQLQDMPFGMPYMCCSLSFFLEKPKQIIIAGKRGAEDTIAMLKEVHRHPMPNHLLLLLDEEGHKFFDEKLPFVQNMKPIDGKATVYVCENFACQLPVNTVPQLTEVLAPLK